MDSWRFEGTTLLPNTGNRLLSDATSYPRRPSSQLYCGATLKIRTVDILRSVCLKKKSCLSCDSRAGYSLFQSVIKCL